MRLIGIDPGIDGAAAIWSGGTIVSAIDLPTKPDGSNRQIDIASLAAWIEEHEPDYAVIENVSAMPAMDAQGARTRGMGATSAFRFGFACGQLRGFLMAYQVPIRLVVPRVWKKHYGLKGPNKEQSRQLALKMFPEMAPMLRRKKDHQRAEAALLAAYGAWKIGEM